MYIIKMIWYIRSQIFKIFGKTNKTTLVNGDGLSIQNNILLSINYDFHIFQQVFFFGGLCLGRRKVWEKADILIIFIIKLGFRSGGKVDSYGFGSIYSNTSVYILSKSFHWFERKNYFKNSIFSRGNNRSKIIDILKRKRFILSYKSCFCFVTNYITFIVKHIRIVFELRHVDLFLTIFQESSKELHDDDE